MIVVNLPESPKANPYKEKNNDIQQVVKKLKKLDLELPEDIASDTIRFG